MKLLKRYSVITLLILSVLLMSFSVSFADGYAPGTYTVSVSCEGGAGRASLASSGVLYVEADGSMWVEVNWIKTNGNSGSTQFTYMIVNGVTYYPDYGQTFTVLVSALDTWITISAMTEAMSEPHLIDYSMCISSYGVPLASEPDPEPVSEPTSNTSQNSNASNSNETAGSNTGSDNSSGQNNQEAEEKEPLEEKESSKEAETDEKEIEESKEKKDSSKDDKSGDDKTKEKTSDNKTDDDENTTNTDSVKPENEASKLPLIIGGIVVCAIAAVVIYLFKTGKIGGESKNE